MWDGCFLYEEVVATNRRKVIRTIVMEGGEGVIKNIWQAVGLKTAILIITGIFIAMSFWYRRKAKE